MGGGEKEMESKALQLLLSQKAHLPFKWFWLSGVKNLQLGFLKDRERGYNFLLVEESIFCRGCNTGKPGQKKRNAGHTQ